MFYGEYKHNLDPKGRLIMPAKFREVCLEHSLDRFFLTRGLDRCVFMFTEDEWRAQESKFRNMPFTRQQSRQFNRMFFSGAVETLPDRQGRFLIPTYLKSYAGIDKDTIIIGVSNRIEIWDRSRWEKFFAESNETFEQVAEQILEL